MYEITPIPPRRSRLPLLVIGAAVLLIMSMCMLATAGALLVNAASMASPSRSERAALRPVAQPSPRPQVIVEPPPNGIDYESAVLRTLYEQVNPSVVNIAVLTAHPEVDGVQIPVPGGGEDGSGLFQFGSGSGFVWDTEGYIVTNYHVVEGAEQVQVTFNDGTMSMADVIGEDEDSDLAVIKIDPTGYALTPVRLGNLDDVYVGMRVAAIGNPFGLRGTRTSGIVSSIGRSIPS
jgi:S1-C subfamily serine protease